jgi:5-formyltetrahydrofolate cyclo-ligase
MAVPPPQKKNLRRELKNRRDIFVSSLNFCNFEMYCSALSDRIIGGIEDSAIIAAYVPIASEIGTMSLIGALHRLGRTVALPHVTSRVDTPRFLAWGAEDPLIDGPFGLRQPRGDAPTVSPDVILAPLLGFDNSLNRIGYGAGHYDRAFAVYPQARRIGLAWAVQQCDQLPTDLWDIPLHAVATEKDWITA